MSTYEFSVAEHIMYTVKIEADSQKEANACIKNLAKLRQLYHINNNPVYSKAITVLSTDTMRVIFNEDEEEDD